MCHHMLSTQLISFLSPNSTAIVNMFLKKHGKSGRYTFDVIYSCLQKSLRRGDIVLSLEMAYEFEPDYVNALKSRLIQNCTEDCPDLMLINDIYNCPKDMETLISFIPVICNHMKCRDGQYGLRIVCDRDWNRNIPKVVTKNDKPMLYIRNKPATLLELLSIEWFHICSKTEEDFISYFQPLYPDINLKSIYTACNKPITFLSMLCVYTTIEYIHEAYTIPTGVYNPSYVFDTTLELPSYVYDKHVHNSPASQRTYDFFIDNCIIKPRMPPSDIEITGCDVYKRTNKGVGESIRPVMRCETITKDSIRLIQTQLVTSKHKPRVFYCSTNDGYTYDTIIKGPFKLERDISALLLSDRLKNELIIPTVKYTSKSINIDNQIYFSQNCFIPIETTSTTIASSKLESGVCIYNGPKYFYDHGYVTSLGWDGELQLLKVLLFRKIIGTNDTCCRNIIYVDGNVYSIDDPVLLQTTAMMFKTNVPAVYKDDYDKLVTTHWDEIVSILTDWHSKISELDYLDAKQVRFMKDMCMYMADDVNWIFG